MTFELQYTDSKTNARAGLITTDHGQIETPIFMPGVRWEPSKECI